MLSNTARPSAEPRPALARLELERLDGLACGCVVSVQRVPPTGVFFVSVEAKGPYCPFAGHRTDQFFRIGDPTDWLDEGGDADTGGQDDGGGGTAAAA